MKGGRPHEVASSHHANCEPDVIWGFGSQCEPANLVRTRWVPVQAFGNVPKPSASAAKQRSTKNKTRREAKLHAGLRGSVKNQVNRNQVPGGLLSIFSGSGWKPLVDNLPGVNPDSRAVGGAMLRFAPPYGRTPRKDPVFCWEPWPSWGAVVVTAMVVFGSSQAAVSPRHRIISSSLFRRLCSP